MRSYIVKFKRRCHVVHYQTFTYNHMKSTARSVLEYMIPLFVGEGLLQTS